MVGVVTYHNRPAPDDFAEAVAKFRKVRALANHYRAGDVTIRRWVKETGIELQGSAKHLIPDDLAKVAAEKHVLGIARHYGVTPKVVYRWLDKKGLKAAPCSGPANARYRATPVDFAEVAPTMTKSGLRYHYNANPETIARWLREGGLNAKVFVPTPPPKAVKTQRRGMAHVLGVSSNIAAMRIHTVHDEAVKVLARYAPTYRCDDRGKVDVTGHYFRHGMTILTPDELLAKAARYMEKVA